MRNTGHTSWQDETKEKAEEKEKKEKKEVKPHTLKSNNPHLTGGEKSPPLIEIPLLVEVKIANID